MVAVWLSKNCRAFVPSAGEAGTRRDSSSEFELTVSTEKPSGPQMGRSPFSGLLVAYGSRRLSGCPNESMIRHRSTGMEPGNGEAERMLRLA